MLSCFSLTTIGVNRDFQRRSAPIEELAGDHPRIEKTPRDRNSWLALFRETASTTASTQITKSVDRKIPAQILFSIRFGQPSSVRWPRHIPLGICQQEIKSECRQPSSASLNFGHLYYHPRAPSFHVIKDGHKGRLEHGRVKRHV